VIGTVDSIDGQVGPAFEVVIGMPAMLAAVAAAGMTPEQNRQAPAGGLT